MKYAIVGSRNFESYSIFKKYLERFFGNKRITGIISGEAKGIDLYAKRYAKNNNIEYLSFPANWKDLSKNNKREKVIIKQNKYGKYNINAGKERNHDIIKNCDKVIAFMKGFSTGTSHDIYLAQNIYYKDIYLLQFDKNEKFLYILKHQEKF